MHPYLHAQSQGDKAAYVMSGSGEVVTYAQLDARSNQGAHLFRSLGLVPGDVIAILMENNARFFEVAWAAQRSGLYFVCISTKLTAAEAEYILQDCGAKVFITSTAMGPVIDEIAVAPRPDDAEDPTGLVFTDVVPASYLENWADRTDPEGVELAPGSTIDIFITARETSSPGTGLMKGLVATTEGFGAQPLFGAIEFGFASGARCGTDAG